MDWNSIAPQLITAVVALAGSWIGLYWSNRSAQARFEKELKYNREESNTHRQENRHLKTYDARAEAYIKFAINLEDLVEATLHTSINKMPYEKKKKMYAKAILLRDAQYQVKMISPQVVIGSIESIISFCDSDILSFDNDKEFTADEIKKINADIRKLTEDFFKKCHDDLNSFNMGDQAH